MTVVVGEGLRNEGRRKRNDLYDEKYQIKLEERNKVRIEILNRRTGMNIENYKNKRREAKKTCKTKKKEESMNLRC